jgi:hypothetical protein
MTAVSRPQVYAAATVTAKLFSASYVKPVAPKANPKKFLLLKSTELSHDQIYAGQISLRKQFPHLAGLEDTGFGEYVPDVSLLRFKLAGDRKFVQILIIGCVPLMFSLQTPI